MKTSIKRVTARGLRKNDLVIAELINTRNGYTHTPNQWKVLSIEKGKYSIEIERHFIAQEITANLSIGKGYPIKFEVVR